MAELLPLGAVIDTIIARQTEELRRPRPLPVDQSQVNARREAERPDRIQPDDNRARDVRARDDRVGQRRDEIAEERELQRRLENDRINDELFRELVDRRIQELQEQLDRDELREIGRGAIVDIEA